METGNTTHLLPPATDSGLVHRLENLKLRGLAKVQLAQRSMRDGVQSSLTKTQNSMRTSPMLWAGVAAGTGFTLGLISRIVRWRAHRPVPTLVVIETSC